MVTCSESILSDLQSVILSTSSAGICCVASLKSKLLSRSTNHGFGVCIVVHNFALLNCRTYCASGSESCCHSNEGLSCATIRVKSSRVHALLSRTSTQVDVSG